MEYFGLNVFKIIQYWIKTWIQVVRYFLVVMIPKRKVLRETAAFRAKKKGKRAFVLANGPSVRKLDPRKISALQANGDFDVFVVNSYVRSEMSEIIRPNFYVLSDPAFFGRYNGNQTLERIDEIKGEIPKILATQADFFVPLEYQADWPSDRTFAFCDVQNFFSSNAANILRPRGYHTLTAYKALAIAIFQGYDTVYICGFDNDYFKTVTVDSENQLYHCDNHFYKFDPEVKGETRWKVQKDDSRNVGELLYNLHFNFKHLEKFKNFPIVNLDPEGLVDCFTKKHNLDVYLERTP